jgi:hypothetical protein
MRPSTILRLVRIVFRAGGMADGSETRSDTVTGGALVCLAPLSAVFAESIDEPTHD